MNDVAISEYVLPLLHPFYVFLVIAFYLYRFFFFALELSKILKCKPEQPVHQPKCPAKTFQTLDPDWTKLFMITFFINGAL